MGASDERATSGGERAGQEGIMGTVARIGGAGEADALAALDAGGAAEIRRGVDGERRREGVPAQRGRAASEPSAGRRGRHGRQRKRTVARGIVGGGVIAGDADLVFGSFVERREIGVADGPVSERTTGGRAIARGHAKIVGMKTPRLHAPDAGTAADGEGVVVVIGFVWEDGATAAFGIDKHARVAGGFLGGVVAVERKTMMAKVIAGDIAVAQIAAALQQQHALASFC